jgi:hypothetical protein
MLTMIIWELLLMKINLAMDEVRLMRLAITVFSSRLNKKIATDNWNIGEARKPKKFILNDTKT